MKNEVSWNENVAMFDDDDTKIKKKKTKIAIFSVYLLFFSEKVYYFLINYRCQKAREKAQFAHCASFNFLRANKNFEFAFSRESATNGHTGQNHNKQIVSFGVNGMELPSPSQFPPLATKLEKISRPTSRLRGRKTQCWQIVEEDGLKKYSKYVDLEGICKYQLQRDFQSFIRRAAPSGWSYVETQSLFCGNLVVWQLGDDGLLSALLGRCSGRGRKKGRPCTSEKKRGRELHFSA